MNIVITGGAGFIGRALVGRCLDEGHTVTVIDNLCTGRFDNLRPFLDRTIVHVDDVRDASRLDEIMDAAAPDVVFHLAAHHYIPFCNAHPQETLRVNVEGTFNVLQAAAAHGAETAVVASTGALYPSRDELLNEDLPPSPVDVYGLSKLMAEEATRFVAGTTEMACVAARLFNTYGPCETNPHLIPHIVDELERGPVVQLGNVRPKRDYVYVDDVAELLLRCAEYRREHHTTVNIGTGVEYSVVDIVQAIEGLLGRSIEIRIDPDRVRAVDKLHQRADVRRLESLAGMVPRHTLTEGLRQLLVHEELMTPAPA